MNKPLKGVSNNRTLFVRVHAKLACDGDGFHKTKASVVYRNLRNNTTVEYLMEQWEKLGGWE